MSYEDDNKIDIVRHDVQFSIFDQFHSLPDRASGNVFKRARLAFDIGRVAIATLLFPNKVQPYFDQLGYIGRDDITDLANHQLFKEIFDKRIGESGKHALILFDLIDFKHINETRGQNVGDKALRAFSEALKGTIRAEDVVMSIGIDVDNNDTYKEKSAAGRIGGDEFGMILSHDGITEENLPIIAYEKLTAALTSDALVNFMIENNIEYMGARSGYTILDKRILTYDVAVTNADHKLNTQLSVAVRIENNEPKLYHYVKASNIYNYIDNPLLISNSDKILGGKVALYDGQGAFSEDKSVYFVPLDRRKA